MEEEGLQKYLVVCYDMEYCLSGRRPIGNTPPYLMFETYRVFPEAGDYIQERVNLITGSFVKICKTKIIKIN